MFRGNCPLLRSSSSQGKPGHGDVAGQLAGKDEEGESKKADPEQATDEAEGIADDRHP
jgi:hypothetical protein